MSNPSGKPYRQHILEQLKTPEDAGGYLAASLAENADCPEATGLVIQDIIAAFSLPLEVNTRVPVASTAPRVDEWLNEIESACNSALLDVYELSIANAPVDVVYARGTADCIGHRVGQIREAVAAIRAAAAPPAPKSLLRDPVHVNVLPPLVITRNGIPCPDQAAALEEFKQACRESDATSQGERPITPLEAATLEREGDMARDHPAPKEGESEGNKPVAEPRYGARTCKHCAQSIKNSPRRPNRWTHVNTASIFCETESALVGEVQHRMDQVVEAAVEWHQVGREGGEWFEAAEKLGAAIESLLELRDKPTVPLLPNAPDVDPSRKCWANTTNEVCIDPRGCDDRGCQLYAEGDKDYANKDTSTNKDLRDQLIAAHSAMPRRWCSVHKREEFKYESLEHELHATTPSAPAVSDCDPDG